VPLAAPPPGSGGGPPVVHVEEHPRPPRTAWQSFWSGV
jgi:hypothetical protein